MKLTETFKKNFFGSDLPTDLVVFNIITFLGLLGGLISIPFNIINHIHPMLTITVALAAIITGICIYIANSKRQLRNATITVCFVLGIILFPVMYFTSGGISCGMVCWFSLGILFIFMLLDGPDFIFMLVTDIGIILCCYIVSYYHPEYVQPVESTAAIYGDVVQSLLITSLAIGTIIKFQTNVYHKLYEDIADNNDQLMAKTLAAKKAQREAQEASQSKSSFLANMSHEIRTPINTIMGMDEMILRETSESQVEGYALDIKTASLTLLSLVNDILDVTKIESGKMTIVESQYSFMSLMHDILNMTQIRAREKGLTVNVEVDSSVPCQLIGDDIRIRQILTNILTNAVKYTHQGHIDVSVKVKSVEGNRVELNFSVKDTGIGIKREDMDRLFKNFERLELSRNRNIEGAGLGMAITQNLLALMGTSLRVESHYGQGSTFSFNLQQGIADSQPVGDFGQRLSRMNAAYQYSSSFYAPKAHFLIVDDNAMNRTVFVALLRETGVQITEASGGEECLKLICQNHYDMIFLDHMMPGMDGMETFKAMGSLEGNKCMDTPVIALTANAVAGAKEEYLSAGFHGFLAKPIVSSQLERTIIDFLPADLVELREEEAAQRKKTVASKDDMDKLPAIEGIDWDYAISHIPNVEVLLATARDFYGSLPNERSLLTGFMGDAFTDESLEAYRIRVHSLKGMSNTIGASGLGALARLCEKAAKEGDQARVRKLTPLLLEEMQGLEEAMSLLKEEAVKEPMTDKDEFLALLEMLKMAIKSRDVDQADSLMAQLNGYSYPEDIQSAIDSLGQYIKNLQDNQALETIEQLAAVEG